MASIDLTGRPSKNWRNHYSICIEGTSIAYSYIRKNACTTFKNFFTSQSHEPLQENESALQFMERVHKVKVIQVVEADFRLCVLRDPISRTISLFQNKFISRSGNRDIFESYMRITGERPEDASFSDFVKLYLSQGTNRLDPHCFTQDSHLMPIYYNSACMIDDLKSQVEKILGPKYAANYFSQRLNSTKISAETEDDFSQTPASELCKFKVMPSYKNICSVELEAMIKDIYAVDYELISSLS